MMRPCFMLNRYRRTQFAMALRNLVLVAALAVAREATVRGAELAVKRHPGHYVAVNEADEIQSVRHLEEPALRGVSRRYYWADLEPSKDAYALGAINQVKDILGRGVI